MSEIECQVCNRLEFGERVFCAVCKWPIRPVPMAEKPWGFDVRIEIATGMVGTRQETRHYKGSEKTARRRAAMVPHFKRVLAVSPFTEAQWIAAYGEGRM